MGPPASTPQRSTIMATLRIHYEGWVALPESFRRKLGLERGDDLEAELVEGTIVLRPSKGSAKAAREGVAVPSAPSLAEGRLVHVTRKGRIAVPADLRDGSRSSWPTSVTGRWCG